MESLNADQNFYSRRPVPRSPERNQQYPRTFENPPLPDLKSPKLPPKLPLLTSSNLQAVTASSYGHGLSGREDPDDFYKEYRGVQQPSQGYVEANAMSATTTTDSRPSLPSARSNGNGSTPKYPPLPGPRNVPKASYRSASSPLDDRTALGAPKSTSALNGYPKSQQPSVKDLLKRFDSNNESAASARKPTPRTLATKASAPAYLRDRPAYASRTTADNGPNGAGQVRAGSATREPTSLKSPPSLNTRSTQRTRFATEDQHSNNTLSSAPRSTRARNAAPTENPAAKSVTNLSPVSPPDPPASAPARRPLFGEVVDTPHAAPQIGYGISHGAPRRTSESNLNNPTPPTHLRSRSDLDISPSSPTAWYLGVTPALDDVNPNRTNRFSFAHNRAHSDSADTKVNTMSGVTPSVPPPSELRSPDETQPPALDAGFESSPQSPTDSIGRENGKATYRSRLPVAAKRLSDISTSSSSLSTRSVSPYNSRTPVNGRFRKPDSMPWVPAGRTATPTSTSKLPTRRSPREQARRPKELSPGSPSLNAYISAPPPKTSPQLRSSRPRQPVSSATTAGSKSKVTDRSTSPQETRSGMKITRNVASDEKKPRKIRDGPVDFEAHRAKIKRAYTKSIHETEQKEIRAENLRRLQERRMTTISPDLQDPAEDIVQQVELEPSVKTPSLSEPLHISTSFSPAARNGHLSTNYDKLYEDSPTLGMPGSFLLDDDEPASAISNVTGVTEIDNEAQTEVSRKGVLQRSIESLMVTSTGPQTDSLSPETPAGQEKGSIQIMLDATPAEENQQESTPTNDVFVIDPLPPGTFQHDFDAGNKPPSFASTLTAASPKKITPHSRVSTPFELVDEKPVSKRSHEGSYDEAQPTDEMIPEVDEEEFDTRKYDQATKFLIHGTREVPSLVLKEVQREDIQIPMADVEYESSDAVALNPSGLDKPDSSLDHRRNLRISPQTDRTSQNSAWTDDSVETTGSSRDGYADVPQDEALFMASLESSAHPVQETLSPQTYPSKSENYSSQPPSMPDSRSISPTHHDLPPLTTATGFGLGIPSHSSIYGVSAVPLWPECSTPPVAQDEEDPSPTTGRAELPTFYNRRSQSSIYQSSRNDATQTSESRRGSDDLYSPRASVSTPRSSTQISIEEASSQTLEPQPQVPIPEIEETAEQKAANAQLKKHLFQRRMLIKELIETESVYLKDMNVAEEIYKGTAEACPKLDSSDIKIIFRNTDEIVAFSTVFLDELKSAGSAVYSTRNQRSRQSRAGAGSIESSADNRLSTAPTLTDETDEQKDRKTFIGANFGKHLKRMQIIYTEYLKNSEAAARRLDSLHKDNAVKVWLGECDVVAKDLTQAWNIDALLVKPVQRLTRYQLLLKQIMNHTAENHPDYQSLRISCDEIESLLRNIDDLKKRIDMVGKIVNRKRKESDVRTGLAKAFSRDAFGRGKDKHQADVLRPHDDERYKELHEKFGDDYLRLQVVLRDVEYYTRQQTTYVNDFLRYLSSIELMMRHSASPYPELESKWARFNMSMREIGTTILDDHLDKVRTRVIMPFEQVIAAYGPPGLAMKKRTKRRIDFEKASHARAHGKKIDEKLSDLVDQYEALNETLKMELPKLSELTEQMGNIALGRFVQIQAEWYGMWQRKVIVVLEETQIPASLGDIVEVFHRDYKYVEGKANDLGIVNGSFLENGNKIRGSQSTADDATSTKSKGRPSNLSNRPRGLSLTSDQSPSLPTPDFAKRNSGQFTFSPIVATTPGLPQATYQNLAYTNGHSRGGSGSPATPDTSFSRPSASSLARPSTSRSYTSETGMARPSNEHNQRRESSSTSNSHHVDGPPQSRYSGLFQSAMPLPDGPEESQRSSRASSRDRNMAGGYNILYLAASLFEFNISATKSEAGYPYLTYQAGEIFDVIGEKGELWLAKNQDDPSEQVGWIWSKHFARLAAD
ncbi:hypothetical protein B7494_g282 [Chlorociboria aeruginascens]|nr:hypothetical protein B7494_g282 [Chlorociboria aeruginascens]